MSASGIQAINIGDSVGPYRIEGLLGTGGRGVVYLAQDCELGRLVAIKVVDRSRNDTRSTRLLLREARIVAALNHPAICGVHEVGHVDGEPFIVMEFVEGTKLSTMIRQECGLPPERALHYGIQVVDAVAHAHDHNVVHGDLKSANIMVAPDGRVKILDFGLAIRRRLTSREASSEADTTSPTELGSGAGTVPYMAPELLCGSCADTWSDIWALGVVFFEMLSGSRPFQGPTAYAVAAAVVTGEPAPLPRRIPAALRDIVSRCLMKRPADRYASISQLASALDDIDVFAPSDPGVFRQRVARDRATSPQPHRAEPRFS